MPLERRDHYGHMLENDAVREKLRQNRLVKNAPEQPVKTVHFPNFEEAYVRRQQAREALTARILIVGTGAGIVYGLGWHDSLGYIASVFCFGGFAITCFVAGSRVNRRRRG